MPYGTTLEQDRIVRKNLGAKLSSRDDALIKEGAVDLQRFIRQSFKENSYADKIIEPQPITADDFYPSTSSDKPCVMFELEPETTQAISMAYNMAAPMMTFGARRFLIGIDRIKSVRLAKEINEMATWSVSLRDILADFQFKEIINLIDARFTIALNFAVGTTPWTTMATTGSVQYRVIQGGMTINNLAESMKYIPSTGLNEHGLVTKTLLLNTVTIPELLKVTHYNQGDLALDVLRNGLAAYKDEVFGANIITTIKRGFVPDGTVYHFSDPKYIGRSYVFVEPTLIVKQHDHSVEFSVFTERCGGIFICFGLQRVDYPGVSPAIAA